LLKKCTVAEQKGREGELTRRVVIGMGMKGGDG
jgi:hypothetical protein